MSRSCALLLLASSLPVVSGCAGIHPLDDDPLLVILKQQSAWNAGDLTGFMAGYHRDAGTTFSSSDGMIRGWDTVLERYRKRYGTDRSSMGHLTFTDLEQRPLGREAVLVTGKWHLKKAEGPLGGVFTLVMVRFAEGWRIVHDHTSLVLQAETRDAPSTGG